MSSPVVVCVLRGGGEYTVEHVQALRAGTQRWWPQDVPFRFVALTDTPISAAGIEERPLQYGWKGWWAKMELFTAAQDDLGDILYFDLDTMIVGPLGGITGVSSLTLLSDFYRLERAQSGVMYLPLKDRPEACAAWMEWQRAPSFPFRGDGEFLDYLWRNKAARWQDVLPEQIVSYKVHVRQRKGQTLPPDARVLCFHGRPRPWMTPLWAREQAR